MLRPYRNPCVLSARCGKKDQKNMEIASLIKVARGDEPAELLLKNARVVNVFSGEMGIDVGKACER